MLQQEREDLKWLLLKLYLEPIPAQFTTVKVKFEYTHANDSRHFAAGHVKSPWWHSLALVIKVLGRVTSRDKLLNRNAVARHLHFSCS